MPKFSLFRFVVCLPLVACVLFAAYSARVKSQRQQAMIAFHHRVDNMKYGTGVDGLVAAFGEKRAAEIVDAKASASDDIAFDGVSRLAKIVKHATEYRTESGIDYSDGFVLINFTQSTSAIWHGPKGMRIAGIRFVGNKLQISIYGKMQLGSSCRAIPQDLPEEYAILWSANTPPSAGSLYNLVLERHAAESLNATIAVGR